MNGVAAADSRAALAAATLTLAGVLRSRLSEAGLTQQASLLGLLGAEHIAAPVPPATLPVLAHLPRATAAGRLHLPAAGEALRTAAAGAAWTQTSAYVARPPGPRFLDGYAHATLAGPADGAPSGMTAGGGPSVALGLLLLGPGVHYPHHRHPADEVYLPLSAARWSHEVGAPLREESPGELLHHRPEQAHAMGAGAQPLLAVYVWTGDVTASAAWC